MNPCVNPISSPISAIANARSTPSRPVLSSTWIEALFFSKSFLTSDSHFSSCQSLRPCSSSSMSYNFLIILSIMFRTCSGSNSPFYEHILPFTPCCKFEYTKKETRTLIPVSSIHISYHTSSKISE